MPPPVPEWPGIYTKDPARQARDANYSRHVRNIEICGLRAGRFS